MGSCPRIFDGKDLYYNLKEKLRKKKSMTTDIQWKLIVSTIFLTLIFGLNVVECCSGGKTTTEAPAETTDAPANPESSTMMNDDGNKMTSMMADSTTENSLYTPYYNATYERNPLIAKAIMIEAVDSNYTQQANESLNDYNDTNLGYFPEDALGGNAGKQKSWIPITGIMGNLTFTYNGSAVKIEGSVKGVPVGTHGFRIHEYPLSNGIEMHEPTSAEYMDMYHLVQSGVCRTSKRHYDIDGFGVTNPDRPLKYPNGTVIHEGNRRKHGLQNGTNAAGEITRHVGDTGNIVSTDVDGWTPIEVEDKMANMHYGHPNSILYRTVVIHQLEDFGRSPIGPRIACGIIWPEMKSRPPKPPTTPTPPTTPAPTPTPSPAPV